MTNDIEKKHYIPEIKELPSKSIMNEMIKTIIIAITRRVGCIR